MELIGFQMLKLKFADELQNGPTANRHITDVLFMIIFILFCCGMGACMAYGWARGKPQQLVIGWDKDGNGCGYTNVTQDYPYLYWPELPDKVIVDQIQSGNYTQALQLLNFGTCVKKCPVETTDPVECYKTSNMNMNSKYANCQWYPGGVITK